MKPPENDAEILRKGFEEYQSVQSKRDDFKEKYKGKIVAIKDGDPIASGTDMGKVKEEVQEKGEDMNSVYIITFLPDELKSIL